MQAGEAAVGEEAAILEDYRAALRAVLADLSPGIAGIRMQLESALPELREQGEGGTLLLAPQHLESLFALLGRRGRAVGEPPLPALDRFDAAVRAFLAGLEADADAALPGPLAARVERELLPAFADWGGVESELRAAVETAHPEPLEAAAGDPA